MFVPHFIQDKENTKVADCCFVFVFLFFYGKPSQRTFPCQDFILGTDTENIWHDTELILGLRLVNERRRYIVMMSLIGWVKAYNQPCDIAGITGWYLLR